MNVVRTGLRKINEKPRSWCKLLVSREPRCGMVILFRYGSEHERHVVPKKPG